MEYPSPLRHLEAISGKQGALGSEILRVFQDPRSNGRGAQLIFTSHDPLLLQRDGRFGGLGRDQVWFAEKSGGASELVSLTECKPVKGRHPLRDYLSGRYAGKPRVGRGQVSHALADLQKPLSEAVA